MKQTEVTGPAFAPILTPELAQASVRFVMSLLMLIGISLLLASI